MSVGKNPELYPVMRARTCGECGSDVLNVDGRAYCDWCCTYVYTERTTPVRGSRLDDDARDWLREHERELSP